MAKKQNKVSVNKIDKIVEFNHSEMQHKTYEVNGETIEIEVVPYLSLSARGSFVNDAADIVFVDGAYAPYMLNFAYKYCLLSYCTNINLPKDAEKINKIIQNTSIADDVDDLVDDKYLYSDILDLIEYRKAAYLKNSKTDEFIESLTSLVKNLDSMAGSDEFKGKNLNDILATAKKIVDKDEKSLVNNILDFEEAKNVQKS